MEKSCILCIILISNCLAEIVIETSTSHDSANLVQATVKILRCYKRSQVQTIGLAGNTPGLLLKKLWSQESLAATLIDLTPGKITNRKSDPEHLKSPYKLQLFIVTASSTTQLSEILSQIEASPWWNHMAPFYIASWSTATKPDCSNASKFLWTAWGANLLNAKFLCLDRSSVGFTTLDPPKGPSIYTYNPYKTEAPDPWHLEATIEGKNRHPWSLLVLRPQRPSKICPSLDFDKTRNLGGYQIRVTIKEALESLSIDPTKKGVESFAGFDGLIFRHVFLALNATAVINWHELANGPGFMTKNATDVVTEIIDGPSEILLNPRGFLNHHQDTLMTYPSAYISLHLVTQHRGYESQLDKITKVVDVTSRLGLLVVASITLVFIKISFRLSLISATMNLLRVALNSSLLRMPNDQPSRIYLGCLFFLYVTVLAIYQGKIASILTTQIPVRNVDTMRDLAELGHTVHGYRAMRFLFEEPIFRDRFVGIDGFSCIDEVLNDPQVACMLSPNYRIVIRARVKSSVRLHVSRESLITVKMMHEVRRNWPLLERVDGILAALVEADVVWKTFMRGKERLVDAERQEELADRREKFNVITLEELSFAFAFLGIGLGCAGVGFLIEKIVGGFLAGR